MADWERRRRYGGRDKSFKVFMEHVVAHKCGWLMEDWVWWLVISVDAGEFLSWREGEDLWWRWYEGDRWWIRDPRW